MPDLVRTVGRYGILRELGRGGMAVVYLARQVDLDRLVALKELNAFQAADPSFARRFVRESRLAGSLVHPNVITVFDFFEHDGTPYIAMEYVARGSLRPYVGRMTLAQIGGVLEGLLAGLTEAEQHAIVHRDLKPENLMVTSAGAVKIADFGIAKATQAADTSNFATATGTTLGTPPYMSPEQAMAKEVGPWTDLYSVGCMTYELFTGRPPFYDAEEPLAILLRHISEPLAPASEVADVDAGISAWIERLTAKDPKARPQSATQAWEELEEVLIGKLGPRWRRDARLPDPPVRGGKGEASSWHPTPPEPATPPPAAPVEGIDVDGTGPETGGDLPAAEDAEEPGYETYHTPPSGPEPPIEGIDLEGTGPDTPIDVPAAETDEEPRYETPAEPASPEGVDVAGPAETTDDSDYETYLPPPTGQPAPDSPPPTPTAGPPPVVPERAPAAGQPQPLAPAATPQPQPATDAPTPPAEAAPTRMPQEAPPPPEPPRARGAESDEPVPRQIILRARVGAIALLAVLVIPVLTTGVDRWNEFAVLSPFEAAGVAVATWFIARALSTARISVPVAAGALIGFGVLTSIASLGLLRFTIKRLDSLLTVPAVVVLLGAVAILAAGVGCLRAAGQREAAAGGVDPAPLVLGLAGTALACVAIFVYYDGFSSLWSELADGESAEFVFEPLVAGAAMLVGLALLGARPRVACGLLLAVGAATALHYVGVIVAAWRAIGEVGGIRSAGFIGVLGGLLVVVAGSWVLRAERAGPDTAPR